MRDLRVVAASALLLLLTLAAPVGAAPEGQMTWGVHVSLAPSWNSSDVATNTHLTPYVIEPSGGVDRITLAFLMDAYEDQVLEGGKERTVLHLHADLAPVKVAVIPLARNKPDMVEMAKRIIRDLQSAGRLRSLFDDSGKIGKCYARQDEIGTPFCVTVDFDTLDDRAVTVRERDSMAQDRVPIDGLTDYLRARLS